MSAPALCYPSSAAGTTAAIKAQQSQVSVLLLFGSLDFSSLGASISDLQAAVEAVAKASLVEPGTVGKVTVGTAAPGTSPGTVLLLVFLSVVPSATEGRTASEQYRQVSWEVTNTLVTALNRDAVITSRFGGKVSALGSSRPDAVTATQTHSGSTGSNSRTGVIAGVVGAVGGAFLVAGVLYACVQRKRGSAAHQGGAQLMHQSGTAEGLQQSTPLVHVGMEAEGGDFALGAKRRARLAHNAQ